MTHFTQVKPGGRQHPLIILKPQERTALEDLYGAGAWTVNEALGVLGETRLREFLAHHLLTVTDTPIGPLIVLLAQGRIAAFGYSSGAHSLDRHLNDAYLRLCLAHLNWPRIQPSQTRIGIDTFHHGRQVHEVLTPAGPALVAGRMTGDGYSLTQIHKLARALRSTALSRDFTLIVLTPNRRRGQAYAKTKEAYLQVRHLIPGLPEAALDLRGDRPVVTPSPAGPHLAGESWKTDQRYTSLSPHIQALLQQPRDARVGLALATVERDGAITAGFLERLYALSPADLPNIQSVVKLTRTTPSKQSTEAHIEFLTLSKKLARQDVGRLAHRCGTGAVRHLLDISGDDPGWVAEARSKRRLEEPDAVYTDPQGERWAIEFDAGGYRNVVIDRKLSTFRDRGFAGTIWGASTVKRQRIIDAQYAARLARPAILAEWWD